jgi:PAS domain S-box-containing protein
LGNTLNGKGSLTLISVKRSLLRHPATLLAGGAALAALAAANVTAFFRGLEAPWLLGAVILTDMLAVSLSLAGALWSIAVWGGRRDVSEARLDAIVDSAMDAIITVDAAQNVVLLNRAAEQMFGVRRDEALGAPLDRFLPARFRGAHRGHIEKFGVTGVTSRRMGDTTTLWALRADGEEFPIEASISQAGEPGSRFFTVILRDISLRKKNEETMLQQQQELRELSARVLEAREEEKARIARELHDELGQLLTALKMDLAWLRERLPGGAAELAARADGMSALLDRTVSSSRRIASDLRPLMLDDLGLAEAAQWLVEDFGKRSGIRLELQAAEGLALEALSKGAATALYRALQESLTNIARHSGAKSAWIVLALENGTLHLEIEDDGRGIAAEDLGKSSSLGLKGMRERIAYYGGSLEVARAPRGGTRLRVHMPLASGGPAA